MDELDRYLTRATEIYLDEVKDETDAELGDLLPRLVQAGYVHIAGESDSGHFWSFTEAGVRRQAELGLFNEGGSFSPPA
jgi:hypothetical protein